MASYWRFILISVVIVFSLSFAAADGGYDGALSYSFRKMNVSSGRMLNVHIGTQDGASFSIYPPHHHIRAKVSKTSEHYGCDMATNAGFFSLITGAMIGHVVSDGAILHVDDKKQRSSFGIFSNGTVALGYFDNNTVKSGIFKQLVTGAGWVVRDSKCNVNQTLEKEGISHSFADLIAPRTAIGIIESSSDYSPSTSGSGSDSIQIVVVVIEGLEKKYGADLYDVADVLIQLDVTNAVNLDGGGSSDMTLASKPVSKPTCHDTSEICERDVTTITCFRK